MAQVKTEYVAKSDMTIAGTVIKKGEVVLTVESHQALDPQSALRAAQSGLAVPRGNETKPKKPKPTTPGE